MRLFRATYRNRDGKKRKARKWYIEFRDHFEKVRRLAVFTDKGLSRELGLKIERLVRYRVSGAPPDPTLLRWLETLSPSLSKGLSRIGLLDRRWAAAGKALKDHVADYRQSLLDKGNTRKHADLTVQRVQTILDSIGAVSWSDLKAEAVQHYLADRRRLPRGNGNLSIASSNHCLTAIKGFCRWMIRDGRASESPVVHLQGLNAKTDRRHDRRALTVDELRRLLKVAANGPDRYGMTGPERVMLYRVAVETGLRAGELRSLTRASFDLDADPPTVMVEAAYSKHRREDVLPLRPGTAADPKAFLARVFPAAQAFHVPRRRNMALMLRADLEVAGIVYRDDAGRVVDFHALRHTFITNLANSGVHPKVAQALARHSTITLTMDRYSHSYMGEQSEAVAALPDLSPDSADEGKRDARTTA